MRIIGAANLNQICMAGVQMDMENLEIQEECQRLDIDQ